jgi:hypothetical protein
LFRAFLGKGRNFLFRIKFGEKGKKGGRQNEEDMGVRGVNFYPGPFSPYRATSFIPTGLKG